MIFRGAANLLSRGGSRASGTATPQSDYDLGLYYEADDPLDVDSLTTTIAALDNTGLAARVTPIGGWGPWINGGGCRPPADGSTPGRTKSKLSFRSRRLQQASKLPAAGRLRVGKLVTSNIDTGAYSDALVFLGTAGVVVPLVRRLIPHLDAGIRENGSARSTDTAISICRCMC
jgi:hypothetical protein